MKHLTTHPHTLRIVPDGYLYVMENFENPRNSGQLIQFIEKQIDHNDNTKLITVVDRTTNEDVLAILIHRLGVLSSKFPCRENSIAITKLDEALFWLNKRTQDRIKRKVEGIYRV